jgi:hypothetical protein
MTAQILSMHAGHASDFGKASDFPQKMDHTSSGTAEPTPASPGDDDGRGRRRDREDDDGGDLDGDATGSSRKRRRSRKGLDKKFECPHEGCGKSYSRAEHLYRHQLNRASTFSYLPACLPCNHGLRLPAGHAFNDPMLTRYRQSKDDLPLRLSRLPPVLRPTRPLRATQGKAHGTGLAAAAQGHVYAESQPHCNRCHGEQERHAWPARLLEALPYGKLAHAHP